MRTISVLAIIAFAYFAEDSIMSDYMRFHDVYSIHVDGNMISQMNEAVESLGLDSIPTKGIEAVNVHNIIYAGNHVLQASFVPLKERTNELCQISMQMAQVR